MLLWLRIPLEKYDDGDAKISSSGGSVSDLLFLVDQFCLIYSFISCSLHVVGVNDSWELWNSFRILCEHHSQLSLPSMFSKLLDRTIWTELHKYLQWL